MPQVQIDSREAYVRMLDLQRLEDRRSLTPKECEEFMRCWRFLDREMRAGHALPLPWRVNRPCSYR